MMNPSDIFQVGGTLERDDPSYIERPADGQLINVIMKGEVGLVLAPRQTGKSSLMVHALSKIEDQGLRWAVVDLQPLGHHKDLNAWFGDVIYQIGRTLKLAADAMEWWDKHGRLGPTQRFMTFIEDVALAEPETRLVVFFDEIDSVLPLPFADNVFTTLRALSNARASNPALKRIAFVLLGVATPSEFIKDKTRTPFNIGKKVELTDFNVTDDIPFKKILGPQADSLVERIFYWTGGQPFLVQDLTAKIHTLSEDERTVDCLDAIVQTTYLDAHIEKDTHLNFIRDYLTDKRHNPRRMLKTYRAVIAGVPVLHDERSLVHTRLLLSGVVRLSDGHLAARNRIYQSVFDEQWIKDNLPINRAKMTAYLSSGALILFLLWVYLIQPLWFPKFTERWFETDIQYISQPDFQPSVGLPLAEPRKITLNGAPVPWDRSTQKGGNQTIPLDLPDFKAGPNLFTVRFYGSNPWKENYEINLTIVYFPETRWQVPGNLKMVTIPAGCFEMGDQNNGPVHRVCLTSFEIGMHEVTQAQWQALMGFNPAYFSGDPRRPIENVSWKDIQEYIRRLNKLTGKTYRLPTEAQWEYACRAGTTTHYYTGDSEEDLARAGWYRVNSNGQTHPVGEKEPNKWGLYDMHGNVWEWCRDWYDSDYYANSPSTDPAGPAEGVYRVVRGGSWDDVAGDCRSAGRGGLRPDDRFSYLGFRLASPPGQQSSK